MIRISEHKYIRKGTPGSSGNGEESALQGVPTGRLCRTGFPGDPPGSQGTVWALEMLQRGIWSWGIYVNSLLVCGAGLLPEEAYGPAA